MKKKYLILTIVLIFVVSVTVRYWPIYHKGFSPIFDSDNLVVARNLSLTGEYKIVNKEDVVLSSALITKEGVEFGSNNQLTPILYSKIFDVLGFHPQIPLYVSLILYGITSVLLFLLILKLFNIKVALISATVDIFMPFVLFGSIWFGFYEWAMLFFIIGISIYLWKTKPSIWRLLAAGLFLGLASLARNAFLISVLVFILYDFYSNFIYKKSLRIIKQWLWSAMQRIFVFVLPVILLWAGFMVRDYLSNKVNPYINQAETHFDGHLFTDPYTYHFEKEEFISQIKKTAQGDQVNALIAYEYLHGLKARIEMQFVSLKYYINSFIRQPVLGGTPILFFLFLGAIFLYKKNKKLFVLSILWIIFLFFYLIALRTSNEDHFLEARFPLVLLITLGIFWTLDWLKQMISNKKTYILLSASILLVLLTYFIQSDKWMFHETYENSNMEKRMALVESIKKEKDLIKEKDIIAVDVDDQTPAILNYYTDYSYVYFADETIAKLLNENKLQWAFDRFKVTRVLGFDDLREKIVNATKVRLISAE